MKFIYYHGGPGFNSSPEANLLLPGFIDAGLELALWDERSAMSKGGSKYGPEDAYISYLNCAEEFLIEAWDGAQVVLIGHSFGAHPVAYLANRHPEKIRAAVFISSALSLRDLDINMLGFIMRDYQMHGDSRALEIRRVQQEYTGRFDENTERGFRLIAENPRLFEYYWFDKDRMREFLAHFEIDIEAFFRVRSSFFEAEWALSAIPAIAVFGEHEVAISREAELDRLGKRFANLLHFDFEKSSHYPQIEEMDRFIRLLADL